ncbi:hypothetical protein ACQKGO_27415 [Corallococcus interemptor]|uniref:hypothetical protein n=1 Tax=Corallococcus interemptor TaxID=2316720 RepID=UPI003CFECE33
MAMANVVLPLVLVGGGLTALFVQGQRAAVTAQAMEARLERLERRMDLLLAQRQAPVSASAGVSARGPELPKDLQASIDGAVARALQAHAQEPAPVPGNAPPPRAHPVDAEQNARAWAQGNELVERALSSRRWGDAQIQELRTTLVMLTPDQRQTLQRKLIVAVNEGQVRMEGRGPLF